VNAQPRSEPSHHRIEHARKTLLPASLFPTFSSSHFTSFRPLIVLPSCLHSVGSTPLFQSSLHHPPICITQLSQPFIILFAPLHLLHHYILHSATSCAPLPLLCCHLAQLHLLHPNTKTALCLQVNLVKIFLDQLRSITRTSSASNISVASYIHPLL
jgi:hypothetical protein